MYIIEVALSVLCLCVFQRIGFNEMYKLIWSIVFASVAFLWGFTRTSIWGLNRREI